MTSSNLASSTKAPAEKPVSDPFFFEQLPGFKLLKNLKIGTKLNIGFGILVFLTVVGALVSFLASRQATGKINATQELRVPTALASARAQTDLLKMLGDVRGYLALGDEKYRASYLEARTSFEKDLDDLESLSPKLNPENQRSLKDLKATFEEWKPLPDQLFTLRDDQFEREPAYALLAKDGVETAANILIDLRNMIDLQAEREPTAPNMQLLKDMANLQGSFTSMLSGLRGYVTTRNRIYRIEYEKNLELNRDAWTSLQTKRGLLTSDQGNLLDKMAANRETLLKLPEQMFADLESDQWRLDLYKFTTEAVPKAETMQGLLAQMTETQQDSLERDLNLGRRQLETANLITLIGGIVAVILGLTMAVIFRANIAGPILRLTAVAERIRGGDLEAQAVVESRDETGLLARTFNNMTGQLRQTLQQVRKEKKRADDLLEVVIPIGVELSAEKNFNRLLENMLVEAKTFCHANGGILYLFHTDEKNLRYVIVRDTAQSLALGGTTGTEIKIPPLALYDEQGQPNNRNVAAHVALNGDTLNIANAAEADEFDFFDAKSGDLKTMHQSATSILTIPIKNIEDKIMGVLQLLDAKDPETGQIIPFDPNLQQLMESFSSLAAAALEAYIREQGLRREIQQLRIEIDEVKRQQEVTEIIETDFFQDLQAKARTIRERGHRSKRDRSDPTESDS